MNLEEFCSRFHSFLEQKPDPPNIFETGQKLLEELLSDAQWFGEFLCQLISDPAFLERQQVSVFPNEVTLYRSADHSFSVLAYLWEPESPSPIHDHGSWGIIGPLLQPMRETRYRRLDKGELEGHAELEEVASKVIEPGRTTRVLPLDKGIHQTGSATDGLSVSVSVYGRSIRKGYIYFFEPSRKKAVRAYPPKLFKRVLAIRALGSISETWGEELRARTIVPSLPEYLGQEIHTYLPKRNPKS